MLPPLHSNYQVIDANGAECIFIKHQKSTTDKTLMWFYGGAFVGGDADSNVGMAMRVAGRLGVNVILPNYRKAPEHAVADALQDAGNAYDWLRHQVPSDQIALLGISSGGGLAMLLMQLLLSANIPQPAGAVLLSPWLDYAETTQSISYNTVTDLIVTQRLYDFLRPLMPKMCGVERGQDEQVVRKRMSPLFGAVEGLAPVFISVGGNEVCTDECLLMHNNLSAAGVDSTIATMRYMPHAWQMYSELGIPESVRAMAQAEKWLGEKLELDLMSEDGDCTPTGGDSE
eukprot:TRINITY_DN17423_c0_g1_i3.p1 TRINITY_DN17423_c0_g1~~TRINITY_DN17423_c0_g1_i3.p1  ORF type:complete len:286 (+),score=62.85 TRINITY_DN17423_c0_g1_i3:245-1102(+)